MRMVMRRIVMRMMMTKRMRMTKRMMTNGNDEEDDECRLQHQWNARVKEEDGECEDDDDEEEQDECEDDD